MDLPAVQEGEFPHRLYSEGVYSLKRFTYSLSPVRIRYLVNSKVPIVFTSSMVYNVYLMALCGVVIFGRFLGFFPRKFGEAVLRYHYIPFRCLHAFQGIKHGTTIAMARNFRRARQRTLRIT